MCMIPFSIFKSLSSSCSIKLYQTKDVGGSMNELSGRDNQDLKLENLGRDMKYAEYFETHGTCCWESFKKKGLNARGSPDDRIRSGATQPTKNKFKFKSVRRVNC